MKGNSTRGLVAKYNLPPYQSPDGTYPIPSAANPFTYPLFPFANPPYAARAYAYSTAQYDALVACWYYETKFNRQAPYKQILQLRLMALQNKFTFLPITRLLYWLGVTAEMMILLFPAKHLRYGNWQ